jgi:hypothetical protein
VSAFGSETKAEHYKEKGAEAKEYWTDYGNKTGAYWKKKGEESKEHGTKSGNTQPEVTQETKIRAPKPNNTLEGEEVI